MERIKIYFVVVLVVFFFSGCINDIRFEKTQDQNIPQIQNTSIQRYTFEPEIHYSDDGKDVYWDESLVKNADLESFQQIVGPNDTTPENLNDDDFYFFTDKNAFYMSSGPFGGNHFLYRYEMENINNLMLPEGMLVHLKYINDGESVYYLSDEGKAEKIIEADLDTFELVDGDNGYARDKNHIYFHGEVLEDADVMTFTRVGSTYKDNKYVYYYGRKLEQADPDTFEAVRNERGGICYYKDKDYVYWKVQPYPKTPTIRIVAGADPVTFECKRGKFDGKNDYEYDSKDKNYFYRDGAIREIPD